MADQWRLGSWSVIQETKPGGGRERTREGMLGLPWTHGMYFWACQLAVWNPWASDVDKTVLGYPEVDRGFKFRPCTPNKFPVSCPGNGFNKVAGNLHFNRYFSEVDTHTTCNNEFTERHPVIAELKDGPRQQRLGAAERISTRSATCPPMAAVNGICDVIKRIMGPHWLPALGMRVVDGKQEIYLEWP